MAPKRKVIDDPKTNTTPAEAPKKRRRQTAMPPPHEIRAAEERRREAELNPPLPRRPRTTADKIRAEEAKQAARDRVKAGLAVRHNGRELVVVGNPAGTNKRVKEEAKTRRKEAREMKVRGPYAVGAVPEGGLVGPRVDESREPRGPYAMGPVQEGARNVASKVRVRDEGTGAGVGNKKKGDGVLFRPTERTKRLKADMEKDEKKRAAEKKLAEEQRAKEASNVAIPSVEATGNIPTSKSSGAGDRSKTPKSSKLEPSATGKAANANVKNERHARAESEDSDIIITAVRTVKKVGGKVVLEILNQPKARTEAEVQPKVEPDSGKNNANPRLAATFTTLPEHLRYKIYRQLVVAFTFIYPDAPTGREQPDLAMTCRQVRAEVLPIYYAENTFAFDVFTGLNLGEERNELDPPSKKTTLQKTEKWFKVLNENKRIQMIGKWAFSWVPSSVWMRNQTEGGFDFTAAQKEGRDVDVMVSLQYPLPDAEKGVKKIAEKGAKGKYVSQECVKPAVEKSDKSGPVVKKAAKPVVEVHRNAFCLLESHPNFGKCTLGAQKALLNVILKSALAKRDRSKQIAVFGSMLEELTHELIGSRCTKETVKVDKVD